MFVHTRSYEDLTELEDREASGDSPKECVGSPPPLATDMRQISQDFSELSTQLTGVARDLQEEMLPGSSEAARSEEDSFMWLLQAVKPWGKHLTLRKDSPAFSPDISQELGSQPQLVQGSQLLRPRLELTEFCLLENC